ncbi:MAG: outer membrane beta-barrel protein [Terracidiphilus sp.]
MHMKYGKAAFLLAGVAALGSTVVSAQVGAAVEGLSRTDVAASLYGAFSGTTSGNNTTQSPSNAAGGLIEVRHIVNPIIGYEGTYSFNRDNQSYRATIPPECPVAANCGAATAVSANAHEVTGDWVASLKVANIRPFALAGVGVLFNQPSGGQTSTNSSTKPVFVYGAGVDWGLVPHLGLRLQYRGNLYKAPDLTTLFTSTGAFTHTAEPMIGVYFRL